MKGKMQGKGMKMSKGEMPGMCMEKDMKQKPKMPKMPKH